jgi:ubiquinone/menaquinone biosynthesis C-methylase UbiE
MTDLQTAWEQDYRTRGRLWGGAPVLLPGIPAGTRVLDIGCGNGKTLETLVNHSRNITAIDFSKEAVAMSRRFLASYDSGDALVADGRRLPFADDAFGGVVARYVIGHMHKEGRMAIASEAARVLQPSGRLFFLEFSTDDLRNGIGREVEENTFCRGTGIITHYFTEHEVEALFGGLRKESVITRHWKMRVRGRDLIRAEIVAVFSKT